MRARNFWLLIALFSASVTFADQTVKFELPSSGKWTVWYVVGDADLDLAPTQGVQIIQGNKASVTFGIDHKNAFVIALEEQSGNAVVKRLGDIKDVWKIGRADLAYIGQLIVRIEHEKRPVQSATVTLFDGKLSKTEVLDYSVQGEIKFWIVSPGSLTAKTLYKTGDKTKTLVTYLQASLKREIPIPTLIVSIPDEVVTISQRAEPAPQTAKQEESRPTGSFFGRLMSTLVTLAVVAGILYLVFLWIKKNPAGFKAGLQKLGVDIPEPPANADPSKAPAPSAPIPIQKIMLDDAAPTAAPAAMAVSSTPLTHQPRLTSDKGQRFSIPDGKSVIGRDDSLALSLANESTVSRRHAEIERSGDSVKVRDLGSTNGTFVNGAQIDTERELRPGDTVQFGSVRFRFEL